MVARARTPPTPSDTAPVVTGTPRIQSKIASSFRPGHPQPVKRGGRVYYLVSELDEFISKLAANR